MIPRLFTVATGILCGFVVGAVADGPATTQPAATDTAIEMKLAEAMEQGYRRGQITEKEFAPAVAIYERAAKAGNAEAMYSLACCYYAGKGVDVDVEAALKWLAAMADKPHKDAHTFYFDMLYGQFEIGRVQRDAFKPILDEWQTLALVGDPQAMARYGLMLQDGLGGLKPDMVKAVEMYQAAAKKKNPLGMYWLGDAYWQGLGGLTEDRTKALQWIQQAADADCARALWFIGMGNLLGFDGGKKDVGKGFGYILRAARMGHIPAMSEVADDLYLGKLGKPDYAGALEWATRAADLRSGRGLCRLGIMHIAGRGVPVDQARGAQYFLAAADSGYIKSFYVLAQCFEAGWGIDADRAEAIKWYRKSVQTGNKDANERLVKLGVKP